jgi:hypothetical protein
MIQWRDFVETVMNLRISQKLGISWIYYAYSNETYINASRCGSFSSIFCFLDIEEHSLLRIRGCIQKFPDWVDNEINSNNKHSRSNTKGYGGKIH